MLRKPREEKPEEKKEEKLEEKPVKAEPKKAEKKSKDEITKERKLIDKNGKKVFVFKDVRGNIKTRKTGK